MEKSKISVPEVLGADLVEMAADVLRCARCGYVAPPLDGNSTHYNGPRCPECGFLWSRAERTAEDLLRAVLVALPQFSRAYAAYFQDALTEWGFTTEGEQLEAAVRQARTWLGIPDGD